jgi:hypothetical protein
MRWLAVLVAVVIVAGCVAGQAGPAQQLRFAEAFPPQKTPQQRAAADAARTLAASAASSLAQPVSEPMTPDLAARTGWWRVDGQPGAIFAWIRAHKPAGFAASETGGSGGVMAVAAFTLPDVPGVLLERQLVVAVAADGPGHTAIRVDGYSMWLPPRPVAENITASARVLTITPMVGPLPATASADHQITVTDPARVARIAAMVDGLPLYPDFDWIECGRGPGPGMRLTFRASTGSRPLAVVTANVQACSVVLVVVNGKQMPNLDGADTLFQQVMDIAGFHWPGFAAFR